MGKNQKSIATNLVIVLLILIILASSVVGIYAWAKYTSSINGTATAQVAKWSFKLVDGVTETTDVIDFAITRTDGYGKVVEGRLAPGTFGEFQIGIDARGTETILEYIIDVELENKPTYLKLYSDEAKTEEILVIDNKLTLDGFMSLEDVKEIRTEIIYWEWPYENGDDVTDTSDAGKTMTMQISVTGYEVLEQSTEEDEVIIQTLADVVSVGDYVNYNASSNGVKTFTSSNCLAGSSISATINTDDNFNSEAPAQWRVLSVDKENGIVELISVDPTAQTVTLSGIDGYANAETVLNNIGATYGQGKGATGGSSITKEDIEQYSSYDKATYTNPYGYKYGDSEIYTLKTPENTSVNLAGSEVKKLTGSENNPATVTQTFYGYTAQSYFENSTIYNMIFMKNADTSTNKSVFWLASNSIHLHYNYCNFRVGYVFDGIIDGNYLCDSYGNTYTHAYTVVPVVTLQNNIQTTGQDENGVWQLKVD